MSVRRLCVLVACCAMAALSMGDTAAAQAYRMSGISPIFDGWEDLPDGTRLFYFGYINRNPREVTIPLGPENNFDPAPADRNQPTHFLQGRHEHVFTIQVPKNMPGKLVWTLKSEMGVQTANASFDQLYILEERENESPNAKPPVMTVASLSGQAGQPITVTPQVTPAVESGRVEVEGAAPESAGLNVTWSKYRGPGGVTFTTVAPPARAEASRAGAGRGRGAAPPRPGVHEVSCGMKPAAGCGAVTAVFSEPGDYTLRGAARQDGLQGLAFVRVTVKP